MRFTFLRYVFNRQCIWSGLDRFCPRKPFGIRIYTYSFTDGNVCDCSFVTTMKEKRKKLQHTYSRSNRWPALRNGTITRFIWLLVNVQERKRHSLWRQLVLPPTSIAKTVTSIPGIDTVRHYIDHTFVISMRYRIRSEHQRNQFYLQLLSTFLVFLSLLNEVFETCRWVLLRQQPRWDLVVTRINDQVIFQYRCGEWNFFFQLVRNSSKWWTAGLIDTYYILRASYSLLPIRPI